MEGSVNQSSRRCVTIGIVLPRFWNNNDRQRVQKIVFAIDILIIIIMMMLLL